VHGQRAGAVEAVQHTSAAVQCGRGTAIDLPAAACALVHDHRSQPMAYQGLGGPPARRTCPDHHRRRGGAHGAGASGDLLERRWPASAGDEQARSRVPSSHQIQQSWHAPIRQKPARGCLRHSLRRNEPRRVRIAVRTVSPSSAVMAAPSRNSVNGARSRPGRRWNCPAASCGRPLVPDRSVTPRSPSTGALTHESCRPGNTLSNAYI